MILDETNSLFSLTDQQANRMMICGKCPNSGIDPQTFKLAFRNSIDALSRKINRYNEWGVNPEINKINARVAKQEFREKNKDQIKRTSQSLSLDKRIEKLKEELSCRKKSPQQ